MAENPGRFGLLDLTDWDLSEGELGRALAAVPDGQAILRDGTLLVPRLATATPPATDATVPALNPDGTVLVTGATGTLGRLFARHLVAEHGVRHLLLASAGVAGTPQGMLELEAELTAHGTDVSRRRLRHGRPDAVAALLDAIPTEHPLTAVLHRRGSSTTARCTASPPSSSTPCCAPRSMPPGTCTS